jgi:hypothetical protein
MFKLSDFVRLLNPCSCRRFGGVGMDAVSDRGSSIQGFAVRTDRGCWRGAVSDFGQISSQLTCLNLVPAGGARQQARATPTPLLFQAGVVFEHGLRPHWRPLSRVSLRVPLGIRSLLWPSAQGLGYFCPKDAIPSRLAQGSSQNQGQRNGSQANQLVM